MSDEKKCECGMPLTDETKCDCKPDSCAICCGCDASCTCGCQEKAAKIKAENAEEK